MTFQKRVYRQMHISPNSEENILFKISSSVREVTVKSSYFINSFSYASLESCLKLNEFLFEHQDIATSMYMRHIRIRDVSIFSIILYSSFACISV